MENGPRQAPEDSRWEELRQELLQDLKIIIEDTRLVQNALHTLALERGAELGETADANGDLNKNRMEAARELVSKKVAFTAYMAEVAAMHNFLSESKKTLTQAISDLLSQKKPITKENAKEVMTSLREKIDDFLRYTANQSLGENKKS